MIPFENLLIRNIWLSLIIWGIMYASDYYLTLYSARLYGTTVREHIVIEGSFELTPYYQKDVDSLRRFSPRFLLALVLSMVVLGLIWVLAVGVLDLPQLFAFALGGVVSREIAILARHARNIALFRAARARGLTGRVEYARWLTLRVSAAEHFTFAGLFFALFLAVGSYLLLGGTVFVLATALRHWSSSRRLEQSARSARP